MQTCLDVACVLELSAIELRAQDTVRTLSNKAFDVGNQVSTCLELSQLLFAE
jgi:hypothetical protein